MWPDCRLEEVVVARNGGPVEDVRHVAAPMRPGTRSRAGKDVYGEDLANHVDGTNVTVQWEDGDGDDTVASAVLDAVEGAWTALVEDGGWPAPVSSDTYLLWVILDDEVSGTGYTVEYTSDAYPEGYPVMYVNPDGFGSWPDFVRSVAAHEFGHAIQYGLRDIDDPAELWYWEASAEWMAELGAPELNTYAWSSEYYATRPGLAYDSRTDTHDYGMFVLNASLAEDGVDLDTIWRDNGGAAWDARIEAVSDTPMDEVIGRMAARYTAGTLRESDAYMDIAVEARSVAPTGETVSVDTLGSVVYRLGDVAGFTISGPARLDVVVDGEVGTTVPDSGAADVIVTRTGEGDIIIGGDAVADADTGETPGGGCGCATGPAPGGFAFGIAAFFGWRRRR